MIRAFLRVLGAIYFIAFASFGVQASGLIGSHGILPYASYLGAARQALGRAAFWNVLTVFWLNSSDVALAAVWIIGAMCAVAVVLGLLGSRMLKAQDNLKGGTVVQRTELKGAPGWEAILVERILPPGAESGKHTQSGNEIVYIQEGSVIFVQSR